MPTLNPRAARREPPVEMAGSPGVLRAIAERALARRSGDLADDGRRIGLVVEGGAMRGVVSGGALVGLADLGLVDMFDVGFGASAGALNLAYFVCGAGERGAQIYVTHAASARFVNPLRVNKIIDLDFLFEQVIRKSFPLDIDRLRSAACEIRVSLTDAVTGRNHLVSVRDERVDIYDLLKASAAVPFYYGRRVPLLGSEYVDGMASNALPVRAALEDGCTHVLVILSSRPGEGSGRRTRIGRDISLAERIMLVRHPQGFRRAYLTRRRRLRVQLAHAHHDERVHVLHPTRDCTVPSRISTDQVALHRAFEASRARARDAFAAYGLPAPT